MVDGGDELFGDFWARNMPSEVTDCARCVGLGSCAEAYSDTPLAELRTTNQKDYVCIDKGYKYNWD
jgi:hypothetical protein